jgi:hypothetical protein
MFRSLQDHLQGELHKVFVYKTSKIIVKGYIFTYKLHHVVEVNLMCKQFIERLI